MREVILPIPLGLWITGSTFSNRVVDCYSWTNPENHFDISTCFSPSDQVIHWLTQFAPSWSYFYAQPTVNWFSDREDRGFLVFGFGEASEATLFKLTWGGR